MPTQTEVTIPKTVTELPELSGFEDLMKYAGVCRRFLEKERASGRLRGVRLARNVIRFRRSDVEKWLASAADKPLTD